MYLRCSGQPQALHKHFLYARYIFSCVRRAVSGRTSKQIEGTDITWFTGVDILAHVAARSGREQ